MPAHHLTPLHAQTIVARWRQSYTRNTCYSRRQALARVLRWYQHATCLHGLTDEIPKVPGPRQRQSIATPLELGQLHAAADPLLRFWLRLTSALALGQNEVRMLSAAHYHAENRTVSFVRKKTGEPNTLPVPDDLAEIFEAAPDFGDPAMPFLQRWNRGKKLSAQAVAHRWNTLKKLAGVRAELTPHDLRRTTATALYDLTKDLRVVQQLLGHTSMKATVSYVAHVDPSQLRPLLAQLWKPQTEVKQ
ncbi:MAG: tyrosine-type recombinase/integrase [Acidobacteria bacterium]|nr:tyrosine-type recombinase/integrase [Acidobacteriota bacterium]MBI3664470.1 tyrosine-type recombinase/integrase [Acidobacteriota bacterium]